MATRSTPRAASRVRAAARTPWADVLASLGDAVLVIDRDGRVADLNPAAEQLAGISAPQAAGVAPETLFPANPWVGEIVRGAIAAGGGVRRGEAPLAVPGGEVAVSVACAPVLDRHGRPRGAVLVLHDLTLQRSLEATTHRADRLAALGTVVRGLAHEIRNPLGGIKGAAQLLRGAISEPTLVRCTDVIIREVERLDALVEQMSELSTPPRLQLRAVNIHRVLTDVLALERQAPVWGHVKLRTAFDPSLPAVRGDRAQLTQVFLNLVKNALEALSGEGELLVSTRLEGLFHVRRSAGRARFLSVLIEDDGPGIPEDDQARLFSPFFSTKATGGGLGLALCQRIVSEHGGTIAHEPRRPCGSRFRVTLPVGEEDAAGV